MPSSDDHLGSAAHGRVNGIVSQSQAVNAVKRIRRNTSNQIAGVNVLQIQLNTLTCEVEIDSVLQKQPYVTQLCIPRRIRRLR